MPRLTGWGGTSFTSSWIDFCCNVVVKERQHERKEANKRPYCPFFFFLPTDFLLPQLFIYIFFFSFFLSALLIIRSRTLASSNPAIYDYYIVYTSLYFLHLQSRLFIGNLTDWSSDLSSFFSALFFLLSSFSVVFADPELNKGDRFSWSSIDFRAKREGIGKEERDQNIYTEIGRLWIFPNESLLYRDWPITLDALLGDSFLFFSLCWNKANRQRKSAEWVRGRRVPLLRRFSLSLSFRSRSYFRYLHSFSGLFAKNKPKEEPAKWPLFPKRKISNWRRFIGVGGRAKENSLKY